MIILHDRQTSLVAGARQHRFLSEVGSNLRFWRSIEWPAGRAVNNKEFE